MFGLVRRSLFQLYHSLTAEVNVVGSRLVDGWVWSSTLSTAVVGPQVLLLKVPEPRNVLLNQGQLLALSV